MPLTTDIRPGTYNDFYAKFQERFLTEQERHEAALAIADPRAEHLPSAYAVHNVLAAQWGVMYRPSLANRLIFYIAPEERSIWRCEPHYSSLPKALQLR
jgi:hypothetical protein